jgi:hypothetical protein
MKEIKNKNQKKVKRNKVVNRKFDIKTENNKIMYNELPKSLLAFSVKSIRVVKSDENELKSITVVVYENMDSNEKV